MSSSGGHIEVMQLAHPQRPGSESLLVLSTRPVAPPKITPPWARSSCEPPQLRFETDSNPSSQYRPSWSCPLVLVQPDRGISQASRRASVVLLEAGSPQISTSRADDLNGPSTAGRFANAAGPFGDPRTARQDLHSIWFRHARHRSTHTRRTIACSPSRRVNAASTSFASSIATVSA